MAEKQHKSYINYLKAFAILLVIFGHCLNYYNNHVRTLSEPWQVVLILVYAVHVPTFFVVSGYLCHAQPIRKYFGKKITRVFIPFVFFSVLKLLYSNVISQDFRHGSGILSQLSDAFVYGKLYWFAYAILACYLVAPLVWKKTNGRPVAALIALGVTVVLNCAVFGFGLRLPTVLQLDQILFYLPFFFTGMILGAYPDAVRRFLQKHKGALLAVCLSVLALAAFLRYGMHVMSLGGKFPIAFPLAFALMYPLYLLARALPGKIVFLEKIGDYSYQLMLFDSFFKAILFAAASRILSVPVTLLITLLDVVFGVAACMISERIPGIRTLVGLSRRTNTPRGKAGRI